jgi:divalent metal cation (Fe/Co/Zn/Cd) transporter
MWTKKEAIFIIFACLVCTGALIISAIVDILNGFHIVQSIVAVIISAFFIITALHIFDDYISQIEK